MVPDKKPAEQDQEASPPPSPSAVVDAPPHPPRKRLLTAGGHKPTTTNKVTDSPAPFPKKTRELPNLSECHSCRYRIDANNGKDRLQTLYSEWRIVLLCKNCFHRIESAQLCLYCFTQTSEDCFKCRNCARRVHGDCVFKYKGLAPSSYAHSESGFNVCVDCWIPKSLAKLRSRAMLKEVSGRRRRKSCKSGKIVPVRKNPSLEDVVKVANCGVEKKVKVAARAREKALTKAVAAKRAVELATSALDLVSKREEKIIVNGDTPIVDDAKLAFQLHRAMNSSPRISKSLCLVNSSCFPVPKMRHCNANSLVGALKHRTNGKCNGGDEKMEVPMKEDEGSCSNKLNNLSGDDNSMDSDSQSCRKLDESGHELHSNVNVSDCLLKCDIKPDRYLLKYSKRSSRLKAIPNCEPKFLNEGFPLEFESQDSGPGVLLNCCKESRSFSDASFQFCAVPLQASACTSGSSLDQSSRD